MDIDPVSMLKQVFMEVLEDYAFMFGDPLQEDSPLQASNSYVNITMEFNGPFCGRLTMAAPKQFGSQVAANVLGLEVDDHEAEKGAMDALKELLNVTCGHLLTSVAGDEPVFDLTVPEVSAISNSEWEAVPDAVALLVEEWLVFLSLTLKTEGNGSECPL